MLTYSYHLPVKANTTLSFGITGKLNHYGADNSALHPRDEGDALTYYENFTTIDANFGLYLLHRKYFVGLSAINIFNSLTQDTYHDQNLSTLYLIGGYRINNDDNTLIVEPRITTGYYIGNSSANIELHTKVQLTKLGWFSLSYSSNQKVGIIVALKVYHSLYCAYKFSNGPAEIGYFGSGSHGIVIGRNFGVIRNTNSDF